MLIRFDSLNELDFSKLMAVYREGNRENGEIKYPYLSAELAAARAEDDFYDYLRTDFFAHPGASYWVWEENGIYISALRLEPFEDGLLLEALETEPNYRKMGYAKKLIFATLEALSDTVIYSHVHKRNKPSLATHKACGFAVDKDYARYISGTVSQNAFTLKRKTGT